MFKEISPMDVKNGDNLIIVNLQNGGVLSRAVVDSVTGDGNFNYCHPSISKGRIHGGFVISSMHAHIKIFREENPLPKDWPPKPGDVWRRDDRIEYFIAGKNIISAHSSWPESGMSYSLSGFEEAVTVRGEKCELVYRKGGRK